MPKVHPGLNQTAIIIGAGPAGLTAALEMLRRTGIHPIVLEASDEIGGISRTIRYKGNRMDIGGHRFFSKSDRVMSWWMDLMPPDAGDDVPTGVSDSIQVSYQGRQRVVTLPAGVPEHPPLRGMGPLRVITETEETDLLGQPQPTAHGHTETLVASPAAADLVMLVRPRKSRIYYLRKFFDYPIKLSGATMTNLGPIRMARIGFSYAASRLRPIRPEKSLQDFLINRFGRELYLTFFKSYTEKVWGTPCDRISAEWGAQRIKGLSLTTAVKHFVRKTFTRSEEALAQKRTDTSLIERFLYPKFGPGQLWEHVAEKVCAQGGEICLGWTVERIHCTGGVVHAVTAVTRAGERRRFAGDLFLSTMPMRDLVLALDAPVPANVREVAAGLEYRDFITVGLLCDRLKVHEPAGGMLKDTWIYVQEPDVLLGRLQIFNNWSPYLLSEEARREGLVWIGLEYFCYETDALWQMDDDALQRFAVAELAKIGIVEPGAVRDAHVVRVPKTYPAYFGTYHRFDELRSWTDTFDNLYLVGRNGMHKYNNQDHSMLTAMTVVDGLVAGHVDKAALWSINTEQDYHEGREKPKA